jgi:uncharacterized membrane protein
MIKLQTYYRVALITYLMQFVLLGMSTFTAPTAKADTVYDVFVGLALTLIKGIPWLVLIPGLIMKSKNVMAWMSYVCLLYFIIWILAAFGESQHNLATVGVFLTLVQFMAAMMYTRVSKRQ